MAKRVILGAVGLVSLLGLAMLLRGGPRAAPLTTSPPGAAPDRPAGPIHPPPVPPPTSPPADPKSGVEARADRLEKDLLSLLGRLGPEAGLARLEKILARPSPAPGDLLSEERMERILAAAALAWCADRQPALVSAARSLARARADIEPDPLVRRQLVWILAGVKMAPVAVELGDEKGETRVVEAFAHGQGESPVWAASLRGPDPPFDEPLRAWLLQRGSDRREKAREAALNALWSSGAARAELLALYEKDPSARPLLTATLAAESSHDVLRSFVAVLPELRDSGDVARVARALEGARRVPEGGGSAILQSWDTPSAEARASLSRAAVKLRTLGDDAHALDCVRRALGDPAPKVALAALQAAVDFKADVLREEIRTAWRSSAQPYRKALLAYGLRGLDPSFTEPNLFWDLRRLQEEQARAADEAERRRLGERMKEIQAALRALEGP